MVFEQTNAGRAPSLSTRRINGTRRASGALALEQSLMPQECGLRRAGSFELAERTEVLLTATWAGQRAQLRLYLSRLPTSGQRPEPAGPT